MWFPYSLPTTWKVESDRQRINESQADSTPREFLVAIQLRNPVLREWSVELQLDEPWSSVQKGPDGEEITVGFFPDENSRLAEITCKLIGTDQHEAARKSYALVSAMLSAWSAEHGRAFAVGGLRLADLKHNARWRCLPHWPSALDFAIPALVDAPKAFLSVANLYREARASSSDRYRFLCCQTILEKWRRGDPPFGRGNGRKGGKSARSKPGLRVTRELLAVSGMINFWPELEETPLEHLMDRLRPWNRAALAFALEGDDDGGPEDLTQAMEWAAVANLVDLAAHKVLSHVFAGGRGTSDSRSKKRVTVHEADVAGQV